MDALLYTRRTDLKKSKKNRSHRPYDMRNISAIMLPLVMMSDFEKLSYDEEFAIVRSFPPYIKDEFDEKGRKVLGIYKIAGGEKDGLYFMHTWSPKLKSCSSAFMLDFRESDDIPQAFRGWHCLNPRIPMVDVALDLCSEMAHGLEGEHEYDNQ
jgi:hypothetical protein